MSAVQNLQITNQTCLRPGCHGNGGGIEKKKQQFCTCNDHSGFTVYVRARPWHETAFAQVMLPVALSYETFVCKLCVALDVDRALVKKVLKIPDILVRTTEDVIRLRPDDRLELVLHSSYWKYQMKKKFLSIKPFLSAVMFVLLLATISAMALNQKEILSRLNVLNQRMKDDGTTCSMGVSMGDPASTISPMEKHLGILEQTLMSRLKELEAKFDRIMKTNTEAKALATPNPTLQHIQTLENVLDQFQQLKNLLRRKLKIKEDDQ